MRTVKSTICVLIEYNALGYCYINQIIFKRGQLLVFNNMFYRLNKI